MIRFAILGTDSGHTEAYLELMNLAHSPFKDRARITKIWGEDADQTKKKASLFGVDTLCANMEDALTDVDATLVLGRFPESHFIPAKLSLEKKLPTFVDKPFVGNSKEARELIAFSEKWGVPLVSFSAYRFAQDVVKLKNDFKKDRYKSALMTGPSQCNDLGPDPRFKDLSFYGIHSVEALLEIFGNEVQSVYSMVKGNDVFGILSFKSGFQCFLNLLSGMPEEYYQLNLFGIGPPLTTTLKVEKELYENSLGQIIRYFSGGPTPVPLKSNLVALEVIEAMKKSDSVRAVELRS